MSSPPSLHAPPLPVAAPRPPLKRRSGLWTVRAPIARRTYWESTDSAPRRALMQTLIGKLDF